MLSLETQNGLWVPVDAGWNLLPNSFYRINLQNLNYCQYYSRLRLVDMANSKNRNIEKIMFKIWQHYLEAIFLVV